MRIEQVIGERVASYRRRAKLSQAKLGEEIGQLAGRTWTRKAVLAAEKGERVFTAVELLALAEVLGTTVGRLLLPDADVDQIEIAVDGPVRTREDIARLVVDVEVRNVVPLAAEALRDAGLSLDQHLAVGTAALRRIRTNYEVLTVGEKLPDDGLRAREADLEEQTRKLDDYIADEALRHQAPVVDDRASIPAQKTESGVALSKEQLTGDQTEH